MTDETEVTASHGEATPGEEPVVGRGRSRKKKGADSLTTQMEGMKRIADAMPTLPPRKPEFTFHWVDGFYPVNEVAGVPHADKHGPWGADMVRVILPPGSDAFALGYKGVNAPPIDLGEKGLLVNHWFTDDIVNMHFESGLPVMVETRLAIFRRDPTK